MKFKKIISAAVGAAMLCASLPIGAMVNLTDNVLKANAVEEPYSESVYPSESYYYGSGEATWEEASEGYSSEKNMKPKHHQITHIGGVKQQNHMKKIRHIMKPQNLAQKQKKQRNKLGQLQAMK